MENSSRISGRNFKNRSHPIPLTFLVLILTILLFYGVWLLILMHHRSHPHHYKVICLSRNSQIQIYSSESGSWTAPALFSLPNHPKIWADGQWIGDWERSVFWNGCVHWIPHKYMGYYFDVVEKCVCMMPALPFPPSLKEQLQGWWCYFGQSGDQQHLYLVWSDGCSFVYTVYAMERDYSGWSMRFRVDLPPVCIACIGRFARTLI